MRRIMNWLDDVGDLLIVLISIVVITICISIACYEHSTDEQLDRLSYRYDADGAFVVCDADSNKCGLYFGTKRIKAFSVSNADLDLLSNVSNIPSVIIK